MNRDVLKQFVNLKITKSELQLAIGEDLFNVAVEKPTIVYASHVISAIEATLKNEITVEHLVEWVNTIWFTELYAFSDKEVDSIVSVFEVLETLDEEDVVATLDDYQKMIQCLSQNIVFDFSA